jgi:hypothetical protein
MIKRVIRAIAVRLYNHTAGWVLGPEVWNMVDKEALDEARQSIAKADTQFPGDPEITRAKALVQFLN